MPKHVLIDKILVHMEDDTHCVSRFVHDLGNSSLLAVRLLPPTGEELPVFHIVNLGDLTDDDQIFDGFGSMKSYYDDLEEDCPHHHTVQ